MKERTQRILYGVALGIFLIIIGAALYFGAIHVDAVSGGTPVNWWMP